MRALQLRPAVADQNQDSFHPARPVEKAGRQVNIVQPTEFLRSRRVENRADIKATC